MTSPNYPHNYGNSESCEILATRKPLYFTQFATEEGKDVLTFGGQAYSGSAGPRQGATTSEVILWRSDAAATASGWRACTADELSYSFMSSKYFESFCVEIFKSHSIFLFSSPQSLWPILVDSPHATASATPQFFYNCASPRPLPPAAPALLPANSHSSTRQLAL